MDEVPMSKAPETPTCSLGDALRLSRYSGVPHVFTCSLMG